MYRIGDLELRRVERLFKDGGLFRYGRTGECERFEARWAKHLGVKYAMMTTSGTSALYCALVGLKVGPGDEVIVPACTYMATALAVLAAGAIPVVADVDESITLCADDVERRLSPHTKAIIPVHMWGLPCNMKALMRVARRPQTARAGGRMPGGGRRLRGQDAGFDRTRGRLQLQLLQEYLKRRGRGIRHQQQGRFRTRLRRFGLLFVLLESGSDEGGRAVRGTEFQGPGSFGRHSERPVAAPRRDAGEDGRPQTAVAGGRPGPRA